MPFSEVRSVRPHLRKRIPNAISAINATVVMPGKKNVISAGA